MNRRAVLLAGVGVASASSAIAGCLGNSSPATGTSSAVDNGEADSNADGRTPGTETDAEPDVDDWGDFESVDETVIERIAAVDLEAAGLDGDTDRDVAEVIDDREHDGGHDLWLVTDSESVAGSAAGAGSAADGDVETSTETETDLDLEATIVVERDDDLVLEGTVTLPPGGALEVVLAVEGTYETTVGTDASETTTTVTPRESCAVSRTILTFGDGASVSTRTETRC